MNDNDPHDEQRKADSVLDSIDDHSGNTLGNGVNRRSVLNSLGVAGALGASGSTGFIGGAVAKSVSTGESGWEPKAVDFDAATRWYDEVGPDNAHPEYPRPQLVRNEWKNLNGVWQFASAVEDENPPSEDDLTERVLVPFPVESPLSGIKRHATWMWYRRTFTIPEEWLIPTAHHADGVENNSNAQRLLLHFERVDWEATVYVNGEEVTEHRGGYDHFAVDVTDALVQEGPQELVVGVFDPTGNNSEPIGTQPKGRQGVGAGVGGISYLWMTPTSGIWDTVWLEPVPETSIGEVDMTPDLEEEVLRLTVETSGDDATVVATATDGDQTVGRVVGPANEELELPVPDPHLWSPGDPFLYNLDVKLRRKDGPERVREAGGGKLLDSVESYFGMRSLGELEIGGVARPTLNGELFYPVGTLESGQWPDGLYTAPTDDAMAWVLEKMKNLGFNMIRPHGKVDTRRWFYHTDRLGLLVWQDMPNMEEPAITPRDREDPGLEIDYDEFDLEQFETELRRVVEEHGNSPSMATWIPINEGWGIPAGDVDYQRRLAELVTEWDPERRVNPISGYNKQIGGPNEECGCGDVNDVHEYPGPIAPEPEPDRISALGEFTTRSIWHADHVWGTCGEDNVISDDWTLSTFVDEYVRSAHELQELLVSEGLSASVYTATTALENVCNGLISYDREVVYPEEAERGAERLRGAHERITERAGPLMANVSLDFDVPDTYPSGEVVGSTEPFEITATLTNPETDAALSATVEDVDFEVTGLPDGWTIESETPTAFGAVANGESVTAAWAVKPGTTDIGDVDLGIELEYRVDGERFWFADEWSLSASLIAFYQFENDAADSSSYGNHALPRNGAGFTDKTAAQGVYSLALDGVDDHVLLADFGEDFLSSAFSERTVSTWIRPESTDGIQCLWNEGGHFNGVGLRINDGSLEVSVANTGTVVNVSGPFERSEEWAHVAAVFDNGALSLYVDGEVIAANEEVGYDVVPDHVAGGEIGGSTTTNPWADGQENFFGGNVDGTALFSRALSPEEISTLTIPGLTVDVPARYDSGGFHVDPESFELTATLPGHEETIETASFETTNHPQGWEIAPVETEFEDVPPDESATAVWEVIPDSPGAGDVLLEVAADYSVDGVSRRLESGTTLAATQIAYWPFDGTTADLSGYDRSIWEFVADYDGVAVQGSHSVAFDGVDDYVHVVPNDNARNDEGIESWLTVPFTARTYSMWVDLDATDDGVQVLYEQGAAGTGLGILVRNNTIEAGVQTGEGLRDVSSEFTATGWSHVAVVFDEGALRLYVDGDETAADEDVGQTSVGGAFWGAHIGAAPNPSVWSPVDDHGWTNDPDEGYLGGNVDAVSIYERAFSAERIEALSNAF